MELIRTTIKQVLRSVVLIFLPLAFTALIVWATAGSSRGTTADPIYTSLWIWLVVHQIPLTFTEAKLSFLPVGGLVLVYLAIRSGFSRVISTGIEARIAAATYSAIYAIVGMLIAITVSTQSDGLQVHWYQAFPITFAISLIFTWYIGKISPNLGGRQWEVAAKWAFLAMIFILTISAIVFLISLGIHYEAVKNLTVVIAPGIFGGVALIALQVLYLPNFILATAGYISGAGAEIGSSTIIHPLIHKIDQLPAIALLGALPRGVFPYAISGALLIVILGFFIHQGLRTKFNNDQSSLYALGFFFLFSFLLAQLSSGQLITEVLDSVGVSWWRFPLVLSGELALGMALSRGFIFLRNWRKQIKNDVSEES
jgi:hypothetical protein